MGECRLEALQKIDPNKDIHAWTAAEQNFIADTRQDHCSLSSLKASYTYLQNISSLPSTDKGKHLEIIADKIDEIKREHRLDFQFGEVSIGFGLILVFFTPPIATLLGTIALFSGTGLFIDGAIARSKDFQEHNKNGTTPTFLSRIFID